MGKALRRLLNGYEKEIKDFRGVRKRNSKRHPTRDSDAYIVHSVKRQVLRRIAEDLDNIPLARVMRSKSCKFPFCDLVRELHREGVYSKQTVMDLRPENPQDGEWLVQVHATKKFFATPRPVVIDLTRTGPDWDEFLLDGCDEVDAVQLDPRFLKALQCGVVKF